MAKNCGCKNRKSSASKSDPTSPNYAENVKNKANTNTPTQTDLPTKHI